MPPRQLLRLSCVFSWVGVPLGLATGGCIIRESSPPPYTYQPAPVEEVAAEPAPYQPAPQSVLVEYERDLTPYGHWVETSYGRCWVPHGRPAGWQPYTVGHWDDTDRGWCWVADEQETEWGVVTYHYGRWYSDPNYGWVWVPGSVWAPAWVAWREGGGYCGWAPLPPQCGDGVNVDVVVVDRYCPRDRYVYCDERYIGEREGYRHYERNDVTIINRTTNITNITYVDNRVINRGVEVRNVEQRSGRKVERQQLAEAGDAGEARRLRQEGRPVVYAPPAVRTAERESSPRLERAMTARPQPAARQPVDRPARSPYPAQAGGKNNYRGDSPSAPSDQPSRDAEAARQRQLDNQERLRQQAGDRASAAEKRKAESQAQERTRQQEAQQRQEALRQQRAAERDRQTQTAAEQRQQALDRQEAAREAQRQRAAERQPPRETDKQRAERDKAAADAPKQRGGQNQTPPQQ